MRTTTKLILVGIGFMALAIATGSREPHFFALPQDQAAMDAYLAAEGRRDLLAVIASLLIVLPFAVRLFSGRGPTVCSNHTDPDLRQRANRLLRDAGCNVYDPTDRRDVMDREMRFRQEHALIMRMGPVLAITTLLVTAATALVIGSKWDRMMTSVLVRIPDCDVASNNCAGIDWAKFRADIEQHPNRYRLLSDRASR